MVSSFTHSPRTVLPNHNSARDNVWSLAVLSYESDEVEVSSPVPDKSTITMPEPFFLYSSIKVGEILFLPSALQIITYPVDLLTGARCNKGISILSADSKANLSQPSEAEY